MPVRCDVAARLNGIQHSLKRILIAGVKDVYIALAAALSRIVGFGIDEISVYDN
jgi:hypothetical protein